MSRKLFKNIYVTETREDAYVPPFANSVMVYAAENSVGTTELYVMKSDGTSVALEATGLTSDYYLKTETYSTAQADVNFLSGNTSYYTVAQADANFLSGNTSYYTQAQVNANFLSGTTSSFVMIDAYSTPYTVTISAGTFVIT